MAKWMAFRAAGRAGGHALLEPSLGACRPAGLLPAITTRKPQIQCLLSDPAPFNSKGIPCSPSNLPCFPHAYHAPSFPPSSTCRPSDEELMNFGHPDFTIYNAGGFPANRYTSYMTSSTSIDISFKHREMASGGRPARGRAVHCSAGPCGRGVVGMVWPEGPPIPVLPHFVFALSVVMECPVNLNTRCCCLSAGDPGGAVCG